jgi:hypothetical protein
MEDAAVAHGPDPEVEDELEVGELVRRDYVSAVHAAALGPEHHGAVHDGPRLGQVVTAVSAPAVERLAVEEELPARGFLFRGQHVVPHRPFS